MESIHAVSQFPLHPFQLHTFLLMQLRRNIQSQLALMPRTTQSSFSVLQILLQWRFILLFLQESFPNGFFIVTRQSLFLDEARMRPSTIPDRLGHKELSNCMCIAYTIYYYLIHYLTRHSAFTTNPTFRPTRHFCRICVGMQLPLARHARMIVDSVSMFSTLLMDH